MKNIFNQSVVLALPSTNAGYPTNSFALMGKNIIPSNSKNPFDFAGQIHNEYCLALLSRFSLAGHNSSFFRAMLINYFGLNNTVASYWEEVYEYNSRAIKTNSSNYHPDIMRVLNSNKKFDQLNKTLTAIIKNSRLNSLDIINEIKILENNLAAYSERELALIYQITSIVRYSAYLWNTFDFNSLNGGNHGNGGTEARVVTSDVIMSDYVGLWVGGIFGGPAGGLGAFVGCSVGTAVTQWLGG